MGIGNAAGGFAAITNHAATGRQAEAIRFVPAAKEEAPAFGRPAAPFQGKEAWPSTKWVYREEREIAPPRDCPSARPPRRIGYEITLRPQHTHRHAEHQRQGREEGEEPPPHAMAFIVPHSGHRSDVLRRS
jgi:hypothetical protein